MFPFGVESQDQRHFLVQKSSLVQIQEVLGNDSAFQVGLASLLAITNNSESDS